MNETVREDFEEAIKSKPNFFFDIILSPFIIGCFFFFGLFVLGFGGTLVYEIIIEYGLWPLIGLGVLIFAIWVIGIIILYGVLNQMRRK